MNAYLIVLHVYDPHGQEHLRVLSAHGDDEQAAVTEIVERISLQPFWTVRSADVYPYVTPTVFAIRPQAQWRVGEARER